MKTILYIGGFELPDKNAAAQRVVSNAKALRDLGYRIVFIDIDRSIEKPVLETKSECFGFERYSMRYTNRRLICIADLKTLYYQLKTDVFAVIAYNYPGVALVRMHIFCKKNSIKLIADCTEWYGVQSENIINEAFKAIDSYIRMNIIQPKLEGMIAISRYLENFYKGKLPTIYVPPLTDLSEEKWQLMKSEYQDGNIHIIYAGNPGRHKDKINKILEAMNKIKVDQLRLQFVGMTKEQFIDYYPEDKHIVDSLGDKVEFLGRIPHEEVIRRVKKSDFSMFYRNITRVSMAGFPTKFSESISSGTPVITNRTSDLGEFLIEGVNGYWLEDDMAVSLQKVFSYGASELKSMKENVDNKMFDYKKYCMCFDELLTHLN